MNGTIDLYKNLLGYILSVFRILHDTHGRVENPVLVSIYQELKGSLITIFKPLYQFKFVQLPVSF